MYQSRFIIILEFNLHLCGRARFPFFTSLILCSTINYAAMGSQCQIYTCNASGPHLSAIIVHWTRFVWDHAAHWEKPHMLPKMLQFRAVTVEAFMLSYRNTSSWQRSISWSHANSILWRKKSVLEFTWEVAAASWEIKTTAASQKVTYQLCVCRWGLLKR